MSDAHNYRASDPVRLELIEANVDMAFSLVDEARSLTKAIESSPMPCSKMPIRS
ncbi:MAG TPA: hypothetical protein VF783_09265 [Terriglobales bacterium]